MRRAINNHIPPLEDQPDLSPQASRYRDMGVMVMLDLCLWAGAKDVDITEYVAELKPRVAASTYLVTFDKEIKPIAYSIWDQDGSSVVIKRQTIPFGDHRAHIDHLRRHLGTACSVTADHADAPTGLTPQKLW